MYTDNIQIVLVYHREITQGARCFFLSRLIISLHKCAAFVETLHDTETAVLLSEQSPWCFPDQVYYPAPPPPTSLAPISSPSLMLVSACRAGTLTRARDQLTAGLIRISLIYSTMLFILWLQLAFFSSLGKCPFMSLPLFLLFFFF